MRWRSWSRRRRRWGGIDRRSHGATESCAYSCHARAWLDLPCDRQLLRRQHACVLVVDDGGRRGEWLPLALPFLLLFPIAFTFAGYRVLRHPPLHRRRTLLLGFIALTCGWFAWMAFQQ